MAKRLLIDAQVLQSKAWDRGMGKYSMELLRHLVPKLGEEYKITLLFTNKLPIPALALKDPLFSQVEVAQLNLALPKDRREENSVQPVRLHNKLVLDKYLSTAGHKDVVDFLILALYLDEVCSVFPDVVTGRKLLVYYDSIPYLYHGRYGQFSGFFENFYLPHTASVYEADKLLTISKTVANDLKVFFGFPAQRLVNIDGASIKKSKTRAKRPAGVTSSDKFILMPTGQELRKNNLRAIRAFRSFAAAQKVKYKLVITSFFSEDAVRELQEIGGEGVVFTGNIPAEELAWLYENSEFVMFPSEYEGLGLPVLEAVDENKTVVCSDIPVFKEISQDAFFYFNPLDEVSIKEALARAVRDINVDGKAAKYALIKDKYTWNRTAQVLKDCLDQQTELVSHKDSRPKIAILCPDPSGYSAIGKVVAETHPVYSEFFDIDYFFDKGPHHRTVRPNLLKFAAQNFTASDFTASVEKKYDAVVYHIGNSDYHTETIRAALSIPGIAIMHDTHLDGVYENLVERKFMSKERFELEKLIDESRSSSDEFESSSITTLINNQKAVIVHSDYAQKAVSATMLRERSNIVLSKLNLPVDAPYDPSLVPSRLSSKPTIALAGIIAGIKGIKIIERIAQNPKFLDCVIKIFGFSFAEPQEMTRLTLLPNVEITPNPSDFEFQRNMAATDILVNVRQKYNGETSLTTLEAMRYGVIPIVRKVGWYDELPENVAVKVTENDEVETALDRLLNRDNDRGARKHDAISFIDNYYTHQQYAEGLSTIIRMLQA